ncbi:MAG: glutamate racemase [Ignavibacteria bacterium]|nr:glutamate racemase [Ignavibacteria bacterium]
MKNYFKKSLKLQLFCIFAFMDKTKPIGVFDSGIGGLSVLKQFIKFLPYEKYIYFGDTARVPYGNKSKQTVEQYARQSTEFLLEKGVKLIVVACNTVSSIALDTIKEISNIPVIGMIEPAVNAALRETNNKRIGIIGTRATISSNAYLDLIKTKTASKDYQVFAKACPLFVPLVEEGLLHHAATELIAKEYLEEFIENKIDTLILACTHYPLLSELIKTILGDVTLIDSGENAAVLAIRLLAEKAALIDDKEEFIRKPKITFYVTDVPTMFYDAAQRFLGFPVDKPNIISIEKI